MNLEVFVHKAEALSEEFRTGVFIILLVPLFLNQILNGSSSIYAFVENFRHIQGRVLDELADLPPLSFAQAPSSTSNSTVAPGSPTLPSEDPVQMPFNFYLTSVYDHTLHDAFSRVFARILAPGSLPYLEGLLNSFTTSSSSSKTFLFDVCAGFYVATDYSPVDTAKFGLCCDYVRMLSQFEGLFKYVCSLSLLCVSLSIIYQYFYTSVLFFVCRLDHKLHLLRSTPDDVHHHHRHLQSLLHPQ